VILSSFIFLQIFSVMLSKYFNFCIKINGKFT
jgi:hypothetical protein